MAVGISLEGCGTGAGDDCGIRDESTRGPIGGTRTASIDLKQSSHDICRRRREIGRG